MDTPQQLANLPPLTDNGALAIAIFVGTLYCFLGYRTLKFVICMTGFILAGGMAAASARTSVRNPWVMLAVGSSAIARRRRPDLPHKLGPLCSACSPRPSPRTCRSAGPNRGLFAVLGAGIVGGLLTVALEKFIVILATAAIGAWFTVCGLGYFLVGPKFLDIMQEPLELGRDRTVVAACWATLAIAGALAQFATNRVKREVVVKNAG